MKEPVAFCWSGGKDSALALYELRQSPDYEVVALLTTLTRDFERINDPKWLPRGWGYVNPLQDVEADAKRVDNSFTTRTAVAADEGEDFEEILMVLAAEKKLAEKYGITLISSEKTGAQLASTPGNAADAGAAVD